MKYYDIAKDFTSEEEQLALKGMISNQARKINNAPPDTYLFKSERLEMRLFRRARKMLVVKYKDKETGYAEDLCPVCEKILEEGWDFCPACGQALTWEDD